MQKNEYFYLFIYCIYYLFISIMSYEFFYFFRTMFFFYFTSLVIFLCKEIFFYFFFIFHQWNPKVHDRAWWKSIVDTIFPWVRSRKNCMVLSEPKLRVVQGVSAWSYRYYWSMQIQLGTMHCNQSLCHTFHCSISLYPKQLLVWTHPPPPPRCVPITYHMLPFVYEGPR